MLMHKLFRLARKFDDWYHNHFGPIRVAFYYENEIGFFCQLPIIQELLKDKKNFKVFIISIDKNQFDNSEYQNLFNDLYIPLKRAQFKKFHFVLATDITHFHLRRNFKLISMSHGSAFGNSDYCLKMFSDKAVDILFMLSESHKKHVNTNIPQHNKPQHIIGCPKLDRLAHNGYSKTLTYRKHNIDSTKKNILIASHWTKNSILATFSEKLVSSICKEFPDFNIIQTAHNKIWTNPQYDEYTLDSDLLRTKLKSLRNKHDNFYLIPTGNIHELLNIADIFVTDISSVIIEFSILDKPILFFNNPKQHFSDQQTFNLFKNASSQFTTIENIIDKINKSIADPTSGHDGRSALKNYSLSNVGVSAKAAVEALKQLNNN